FVGTDSILAIGNHPDSSEPLLKRDGGILEYGSHFGAELLLGVLRLALPQATSSEKANVFGATGWTHDAIRPATRNHVLERVVWVAEKLDCFVEGARLFHRSASITWKQNTEKALLSQVYYYP